MKEVKFTPYEKYLKIQPILVKSNGKTDKELLDEMQKFQVEYDVIIKSFYITRTVEANLKIGQYTDKYPTPKRLNGFNIMKEVLHYYF